jgi:dTDP-4-amino-4,6-dideoxygalactose transaminase/CelD/BcsL family acetyltransferase involved in cellulose biosynthesis
MMRPVGPPAAIGIHPPLTPGVWLRPAAEPLPFPLAEPHQSLFRSVPPAISEGVRGLGLAAGDEVLVPVHHDGAEASALTSAGLRPVFFRGGADLAPEEDELERLVGARTRLLCLVHHLGFPQDAQRWRRWCDERGIVLLEDAAQAWLATAGGKPVGSWGHLAVFGMHKTLGVPEGAALISETSDAGASRDSGRELRSVVAGHGRWLAERLGMALADEEGAGRDRRHTRGPGAAVQAALARCAYDDAAAGRRANYRLLLAELGERVPHPFASLPGGASPLVFPVVADRPDALISHLRDRRIAATRLWHGTLASAPDPHARTVGLPVHQELGVHELDRLIDGVASRPPRASPLRVERVPRLQDLADEWDDLAARSGNLFATREWIFTWWDHFGAGRPLRLFACREVSGRLVAILPAFESVHRPVRTLRFIGHALGDRVGPICSPADAGRTARALARALGDGTLGADVLIGEQLPAEERWGGLIGATTIRREASPVLDIDGATFEDWLASRSRNFRDQVRRRERRLRREHTLEYRLCDSTRALEEDMETLFDLHTARWGSEGEAFLPQTRPFHRDFARLALARGWLQLWLMELDGRPVAAWQGYRYGDADWYYQAGRDPAYEASAVGFVLLAHSIREAMAAGVREYRLGRGGEDYKRRFSNRDPGLEKIVAARGVGGNLSRGAAATAAALPPAWRRGLARLAG